MLMLVPILGVLAVSALIVYGWLQLYGFRPKFGHGQIDAQGRVVGPGLPAAIDWDLLARIEIVTTDQGPFQDDVFWLFVNADGSACSIAGGDVGSSVLDRVSELPGVHFDAIIQAMGSCEDARFVVWRGAEPTLDEVAGAPEAAAASV